MIHNVLHNMLRAKNPPSHFPLPGPGSASQQCKFIQQLLVCLALIIREGHATFLAGLIGGRGGAVGGARRRSAGLDSRGGPVVLGWILGVPGEHLARNLLPAGPCSFVHFIKLLHGAGVPVQAVKPGINHGILSLPEGRHSEEARQTWAKQFSSRRTDAGPRLATGPRPATGVMLCPSAPGESADASMDDTVMDFMLCRGILREHVGLEVGDEGLEVGEHPLGRCPSTYAAHANKIVSEPYQEEQCSKMQCQRSKHWIASDLTLLNCQTRRTKAKLESMILWINAVDSENQPACPPIIASVELTKPTWHVLWLENLKQDESMKHQCDRNLHIDRNVCWFESQEIPPFHFKTSGNLMIRSKITMIKGQPGQPEAENWLGESSTGRTYTFRIRQLFW